MEKVRTDYNFAPLQVKSSLRHSLVSTMLPSRHATAIVFGYYGRRKSVIALLYTLNNHSRAFIITQDHLPGFTVPIHINCESWLYEFFESTQFRLEVNQSITQEEVSGLREQL